MLLFHIADMGLQHLRTASGEWRKLEDSSTEDSDLLDFYSADEALTYVEAERENGCHCRVVYVYWKEKVALPLKRLVITKGNHAHR